jgi:hypothetical protein
MGHVLRHRNQEENEQEVSHVLQYSIEPTSSSIAKNRLTTERTETLDKSTPVGACRDHSFLSVVSHSFLCVLSVTSVASAVNFAPRPDFPK